MHELGKARGALVLGAVLFSTGGVLIKAVSLGGWQVACLRSLVAAAAFPLLVPLARRRPTRGEWLVGVSYAATLVLFVIANKLTTSASAIFLQSAAPLFILVLSPWLLGERASRRDVPAMLALAAGLALLLAGEPAAQTTAPDPRLGNALATASGLTWALTLIGLRRLGRGGVGGGLGVVLTGNLIAALVCLPLALPIAGAGVADWAALGFLGVVQIALAYRCVIGGLARVPAFEASLILLVEPVFNPLWTWLLFAESPGALALLGGAVVAGTTVVRSLARAPASEPAG
jgi:drug/metabolite transporter (DMT)-like permease